MHSNPAGLSRIALPLLLGLIMALASCGAAGNMEVHSGKTGLSAPQLLRTRSGGKQVSGAPAGIRVDWTFVDDPSVAGYYLYRDIQTIPDPGPDGHIDPSLRVNGGNVISQPAAGPEVEFIDLFTPVIGQTYFYRVTVVDTSDEESYPSNELSWTVHGHTVTAINPTSAYYGDAVVITGDTFGTYDALSDHVFFEAVAGGQIEGAVTAWGDLEITATVPVGAIDGPVSVSIDGTIAQSDEDLIILNPIITGLDPAQQFTGQGILINGFNFKATQDTSTVQIGGTDVSADVTSWSDTQIALDIPAGSQDGDLSVTVSAVESGKLPFFVRPAIAALDIATPQSGETLSLSGSDFEATAGKIFVDGNAEQVVGTWADDSVTFTLNALVGAHTVNIEDQDGVLSNTVNFTVVPDLSISLSGLTAGQVYRPATPPVLTATTADDAEKVELLVDDVVLDSSTVAPFTDLSLPLLSLNNGDHTVSLRATRRSVVVQTAPLSIQVFSLLGDINGDGTVDNSDTDELKVHLGLHDFDAAYRVWFDGYEDGIINEADLMAIGYFFGDFLPPLP